MKRSKMLRVLVALLALMVMTLNMTACEGGGTQENPDAWRAEYVGKYEFDRIVVTTGTSWGGDCNDILDEGDNDLAYEAVAAKYGKEYFKEYVLQNANDVWIELNADGTAQKQDYYSNELVALTGTSWSVSDWGEEDAPSLRLKINGMMHGDTQWSFEYGRGIFNFNDKEITIKVRITGANGNFNPNADNNHARFSGQYWSDSRWLWAECEERCRLGDLILSHNHISTDFDGERQEEEYSMITPSVYFEFYAVYKIKS